MAVTQARVCLVRATPAMTSEEEEQTLEEAIPEASTLAGPDRTFHKTTPEVNRGRLLGQGECTEATPGPHT